MKIPLSARLRACCDYIPQGARIADIGTDHGYLGIWLLQQGIARSVIASDIVPGPLSSAQRNAEKFGYAHRMEFYLSDGACSIPRDFDILVCAGMGGDTMVSILSAAPWLKNPQYTLILQCQTKTPILRRYLSESGWKIHRETVIRDGKFLYTVMQVLWQPGISLTCGQWYFPPAMQAQPSADAAAYYRWIKNGLVKIVSSRGDNADPTLIKALEELEALELDPALGWLKEEHYDNS